MMRHGTAQAVEEVYRTEWGRIVATLIGLIGDFDLAEESAQEAFAAALEQWEQSGVPDSPRAWIVQTARFKAIDRIRRQKSYEQKIAQLTKESDAFTEHPEWDGTEIPDDRLRLIFTCCHPALAVEAQVALTLRTLCGLQTDEIARAFLVPEPTMAQRLVRAKRKIKEAGIPYAVPERAQLGERLNSVLTVIYLVFNEGYAATSGSVLVRTDLCSEAIRLARLLRSLLRPNPPGEVTGLLALMLLQDSRRDARYDEAGDLILLEHQDRSRWHHAQIREALELVAEASGSAPGRYTIQAGIAAVHAQAPRMEDTDWTQILRLYDLLLLQQPSPIVRLNRAVALAMLEGPRQALQYIQATGIASELDQYHLLHAVRADLLRRAGEFSAAGQSYERALELARNESERRFLQRRLEECRLSLTR